MRLPNLLASKWGRLIAFFCLYVTEGIPLGFTGTAMAVHLSKSGLSDLEVGIFTGWLYIPWAFKWVVGPVVDLVYSKRLGHRRTWILCTQIMMIGTLLSCIPIGITSENVKLLTIIIFVHNLFCATQDVAIDALACNVLKPQERGLANGLMFAGQTLGIPLGGACVLYLTNGLQFLNDPTLLADWPTLKMMLPDPTVLAHWPSLKFLYDGIPFGQTYWFVCGCIFMVTLFVTIPMKEQATPDVNVDVARLGEVRNRLDEGLTSVDQRLKQWAIFGRFVFAFVWIAAASIRLLLPQNLSTRSKATRLEIGDYMITAGQSFFGSRVAFAGLVFALLPAGAVGLNLAIQKLLAVRLGMEDGEIADLEVVGSIVWAGSCVLGGVLSDRLGHLKCLAVFLIMMSVPTVWLGLQMQNSDWNSSNTKEVSQSAGSTSETSDAVNSSESETESNLSGNESDTADSISDGNATSDVKQSRPRAPQILLNAFWYAAMAYMSCQGLMYGTRTAIFMQISNPNVAATQFTAYMALMNLVTAYSAWWQGFTVMKWGYGTTLFIDAAVGLVCLAVLPFLREKQSLGSDQNDPLVAPQGLHLD